MNAWGGAVFEALEKWIPECGADVLCLQEVTRTQGLTGWTRFRDAERALPQRANLYDDVCNLLPTHAGSFVASDAGPVRTDDGRAHAQEFGLGLFVDPGLDTIEQRSMFVHGTFVHHDEWAIADRPRTAQAVRVVDNRTRRVVTVVHLHGLRDPAGKHDTPARRRQAERLVELVTGLRGEDDLVVVCGDFNLLPGSETLGLLREIGLTDLVGDRDTRTSRYTKPIRHANYLLVSDPDAVVHFDAPATPEVSDHRPLVLDI